MEKNAVIEFLSNMKLVDLIALTKELEEKWEVSSSLIIEPSRQDAPPEEEQTEFNVILLSFNDKKIQVIKEVRIITSLGLKESKELAESAPVVIRENVGKEEAAELVKKLTDAGATVEIK